MIKFNNVNFSYGNKKVLEDFSLKINKGDRICLFGDSGSGKTTVLRLMLGLEKPQSGEITNNSKPSVVFQEDRLLPFKTVLENITLFGVATEKANQILLDLGLGDYINQKPAALSGGMCRRLAIARALCLNFDYLVLDEPFTGLDQSNIDNCVKIINKVLGDQPLILVTHSKAEAELLNCKIVDLK